MKRCPKCNRSFPEDSQKFCTVDGGLLIAEPAFDPSATMRATSTDLGLPTEILGAPIARAADGLALSSRNAYLDARERAIAGNLNKVLKDVAARAKETGDLRDVEAYGAAELCVVQAVLARDLLLDLLLSGHEVEHDQRREDGREHGPEDDGERVS